MSDPYVLPEVLIGLGIIAFAWRYGFEELRRDDFRFQIRRFRDHLFDFVWQNGLDFEDPAYQNTRKSLNSVIFLAGAMRPLGIIIAGVLTYNKVPPRHRPRSPFPKMEAEIDRVTAQMVRETLKFLFRRPLFSIAERLGTIRATQRGKDIAQAGVDYVIDNPPAISGRTIRRRAKSYSC